MEYFNSSITISHYFLPSKSSQVTSAKHLSKDQIMQTSHKIKSFWKRLLPQLNSNAGHIGARIFFWFRNWRLSWWRFLKEYNQFQVTFFAFLHFSGTTLFLLLKIPNTRSLTFVQEWRWPASANVMSTFDSFFSISTENIWFVFFSPLFKWSRMVCSGMPYLSLTFDKWLLFSLTSRSADSKFFLS